MKSDKAKILETMIGLIKLVCDFRKKQEKEFDADRQKSLERLESAVAAMYEAWEIASNEEGDW